MPSLAFGQRIVLQDAQNILGPIPKDLFEFVLISFATFRAFN
jgi:hypothetical protein